MVSKDLFQDDADKMEGVLGLSNIGDGKEGELLEYGSPQSLVSPITTFHAHNSRDATPAASKSIQSLPNELLSSIFAWLDSPPLSASGLHEEPTPELTSSTIANLKAISLVSKLWRSTILPILFKHPRFTVPKPKLTKRPVLNDEIQHFLKFIRQNSLEKVILSFVLLVHDDKVTNSPDETQQLNGFASFWESLFSTINPLDLLIIAPGEALGGLTSCNVPLGDKWCFDCPYQYLRLQQPPVKAFVGKKQESPGSSTSLEAQDALSKVEESAQQALRPSDSLQRRPHNAENSKPISQSDWDAAMNNLPAWELPRAQFSTLFDIRPWSTILLNEGSFIKAYSTYEFWLRQHPSILSELLAADETSPRGPYISPTIRQFSYIAMFPMTTHFSALSKNLPRLERLFVQLVPRNNILENPEKMEQVVTEDLWMERNSCYALLMRELFNAPPLNNYRYLEIFESGDAADTNAWLMAVEYVKRAGNGWKVASEGVFTREPEDLPPEPSGGDDEEGSTFHGALVKWAWNGTTKLPVSAVPLYDRPMGPLM